MKKIQNFTNNNDNGNYESKIIKKENSKFIKFLFIASIIILSIILISCIIDIYLFFENINLYLAIGVTSLIILLLLIFVVRPIIMALSTPCFTLDVKSDNKKNISKKNYRKLRRVAKNIIKSNNNVSSKSKEAIKKALQTNDKKILNDTLKRIYDTEINKDINRLIIKRSTEVLIATAVSQNNKFDAATTIVLNIRLIMQIVVRCGYHPNYPQLSKLIIKVMRNAIIAYTIQSLNLEDIIVGGLNKLVKGAISAIPGLNEITKSITQGAANALLTLRIGILTRKYLYEEYNIQSIIDNNSDLDSELVKETVLEANEDIDIVINECRNKKVA